MKLLPVLDLMHGQVVRGIAGRRAEYRPLVSKIASDCRPETVTRALVAQFCCRDLYLADLDAIAGTEPDWETYASVADIGVQLIIDAGVGGPKAAQSLVDFALRRSMCIDSTFAGIVVGLESIADPDLLPEICPILGVSRAIFSLDLRDGIPVTCAASWRDSTPRKIAEDAIAAGIRRLIVLDIARVGTDKGPTTAALCRALRSAYPDVELISGGGVRSTTDAQLLLDAGCDRVLVASALHDGRITGRG